MRGKEGVGYERRLAIDDLNDKAYASARRMTQADVEMS